MKIDFKMWLQWHESGGNVAFQAKRHRKQTTQQSYAWHWFTEPAAVSSEREGPWQQESGKKMMAFFRACMCLCVFVQDGLTHCVLPRFNVFVNLLMCYWQKQKCTPHPKVAFSSLFCASVVLCAEAVNDNSKCYLLEFWLMGALTSSEKKQNKEKKQSLF